MFGLSTMAGVSSKTKAPEKLLPYAHRPATTIATAASQMRDANDRARRGRFEVRSGRARSRRARLSGHVDPAPRRQSRSTASAIPRPPLTQRVARPRLAPRRAISCSERHENPRAGRADRVAEGDRAAVDVEAIAIDRHVAQHGEHLRRERLVQLDEIEVVDRELQTRQQFANCRHWTNAHDPRIDAGRRPAQNTGERTKPATPGFFSIGEHHGGATVGDAGR